MTCPYITILDRECGRPATNGEHCDLHYVLTQLDTYDSEVGTVVVIPPSVKPMVEHLLGTVVEYWHVQRPGSPFEPWNMNPTIYVDSPAYPSRQMNGDNAQ